MATKAKLTLSQLLFRRTSSNSNNSSPYVNNNNNTNNDSAKSKSEQFSGGSGSGSDFHQRQLKNNSFPTRKASAGIGTASISSASGAGGARHGFYETVSPPVSFKKKGSQPQLQGILKKPSRKDGEFAFAAGKPTRSSLHRSKSNPNPSNNPLKEVSWSCPTLEKRREVILNYFERIILENKQEQNGGKMMRNSKPNIPYEGNHDDENIGSAHVMTSGGEPIYEEISDLTNPPASASYINSQQSNTGSLKPKVMPKKVRMNIPQDHNRSSKNSSNNTDSPIYDRVLCRSHSMIESLASSASSTASSSSGYGGYYDVAPSTVSISSGQNLYENDTFSPPFLASEVDYGGRAMVTRLAGRSHSFHENYRIGPSPYGDYNIQVENGVENIVERVVDTDQLYAKVCKRKKMLPSCEQMLRHQSPLPAPPTAYADKDTLSVHVSCGNVVTMIPVIMPCSSSFSTSCLSLSSSSDNNSDDTNIIIPTITATSAAVVTSRNNDHDENDSNGLLHYDAEKILPDKHIGYASSHQNNNNNHHHNYINGDNNRPCCASSATKNRNNLSVIHLLATYNPAKEMEEFIPTTPKPSFTAIIDSTECSPKSISVPVRVDFSSDNLNCAPSAAASSLLQMEDLNGDNDECTGKEAETCYKYSPASREPVIVTKCSLGYKDDYEDEEEDKSEDKLSTLTSSSSTSTDSSDDDDENVTKYTFTPNARGVSRFKKTITFQDDPSSPKGLLLLTTSESEDDDLCEHKSLIEMNTAADILVEPLNNNKSEKYMIADEEDRGFDSFLDDNDNGSEDKGDSPFKSENLRNQLTFTQSLQDIPQDALKKKAANVLDLINSEISDLHMRELELKKLHGSSPTTTESSVTKTTNGDGNTPEESEDGSSGEDDFSDSAIEYDGYTGSHNSSGQVSPAENLNDSHHEDQTDLGQNSKIEETKPVSDVYDHSNQSRVSTEVKVRPLSEEEDKTIKFDLSNETPIEREIRLAREREEEFRRQTKSMPDAEINAPTTASLSPVPKTTVATIRHDTTHKQETASMPLMQEKKEKDVQYEKATARFKKEIEESMQREREVLREIRSSQNVTDEEENNEAGENLSEETKTPEQEEKQPDDEPATPALETTLRKPTLAKLPISKLPAARFFSPPAYNGNKPNRITPVVSPIINRLNFPFPVAGGAPTKGQSIVGGSLPVGISRPSFTPFEKYILQSSLNFKGSPVTPPVIEDKPKPLVEPVKNLEDPLRIVQKVNKEENGEGEEVLEKPKRRYISAQDKIHREIQDLAMREKELSHTRAKWKSTLDLPESMKNAKEDEAQTTQSTLSLHTSGQPGGTENTEIGTGSPTENPGSGSDNDKNLERRLSVDDSLDMKRVQEDVRQVTRIRAPARRRHSLLINQWEERIRQQQQTNKK